MIPDPPSPTDSRSRSDAEGSGRKPAPWEESKGDPGDDLRLMAAVQAGDMQAFQALYDRHFPGALAVARRMLRDDHAAEDLVQEAFLRVYRARQRYTPTARFTTWLYHIVTNLVRNHVRDRARKPLLPLSHKPGRSDETQTTTGLQPIAAALFSPDAGLHHDDRFRRVEAALAQLPESQRLALILNKYEDLPYSEIATILDTTEKAVKSLLARARENLRQTLAPFMDELIGEGD